ncbi:CBS domain-containing protein [Roseiconus nitratireducens]|uniref:CBS domain-containing protein n=1 Tax=Roseiconus nitratireducens TaxID=2605748 RepID=A0A5M6DC85_9BACT|nr:CBS domain-containing protein [Roseiconus nitratireducens]KAA5542765.1 CBS domain-containing protein [Roseiconus nitratireducens]
MKTQNAPLAEDLMNRNVQAVQEETPLADVVTFLLQHRISNAPVVRSENGQPILLGFLSEADCLEQMSNELFYGNPSPSLTARTMMQRHPVCVCPKTDLFTLASIFTSHKLRHFPVVEEGVLVGIVGRRDVLKAMDRYYRDWVQEQDRPHHPIDVHEIMNMRFLVDSSRH